MIVKRVTRVQNPRRKHKRAKNAKRRKMSAKQIRIFGTKRQKAALKRKRRPRAAVNPRRKRRNFPKSSRIKSYTYRGKTHVVGGRKKKSRKGRKKNPAQYLLTLGFLNPQRKRKKNGGSAMAKTRKRRKNARRRVSAKRRVRRVSRRRNSTRIVVVRSKRRRNGKRYSRRRRNPSMFGISQPAQMGKAVIGGLAGVAIVRTAVPMLPAQVTSSTPMAVVASIGVALAAGWAAGKFLDANVGSAVMFGGLMQAASTALNAYLPQVGGFRLGLSGRRGVGDYVPASFPVPQNPVLVGGPSMTTFAAPPARRAYGPAYGGR